MSKVPAEEPEALTDNQLKEEILQLSELMQRQAENSNPITLKSLEGYQRSLGEVIRGLTQERSLTDEVRDWITSSSGIFLSSDVVKDLNLSSRSDKKNLSKILERLAKESTLIARSGEKRGTYRVLDPGMAPMDWQSCDVSQTVNLKLPLGLHKLMHLYPRNIIVVAGDTNAGKTALMLNIVQENANIREIDYFTNDLTPEELKKRVARFEEAGMNIENFSKCHFIPRIKDFLDILNPDKITIIDYLKLTDKFWLVAEVLDQVQNKLRKGNCIVAIQKAKGQKMGRGADFAAEAARLYLTMEKNKIHILKMKNLIDPQKDPNGKWVKFSLWGGCKFVPQGGWQEGL